MAVALLVLTALSLGACTDEDDAPAPDRSSPSSRSSEPDQDDEVTPSAARVGVVVPPGWSGPRRAALREDLAALDERIEDVAGIRTVAADGEDFVGDLAGLLADRGTDLTCVLGPEARATVLELAAIYADLRFCAAPAEAEDGPVARVDLLEVRFEQLGHVVGVGAAIAAGDDPVALVMGSGQLGGEAFAAGFRAGAARTEVLEPAVDDGEDGARDAVDDALEQDAEMVVVDAGSGSASALRRAVDAGATVAAASPTLERVPRRGRHLLGWEIAWDEVLGPALERLADPDTDRAGALGFDSDALEVSPARGSTARAREALTRAIEAIEQQRRDPLDPLGTGDDADDGTDDDADGGDDDENGGSDDEGSGGSGGES